MDKKTILVVGAGISGITTAIEAAEVGHEVVLVERLPYLGGRVAQLGRYFPKLCPPYCGLEINFRRIKNNPRVQVHTSTELVSIRGDRGAYTVELLQKPQYVNDRCTACGACVEVCPVTRDDDFNYGLTTTKAIYLPHEMAYPYRYAIDTSVCKKLECKKCVDACAYRAIDFSRQDQRFEVKVHSVVLATGWTPYDATKIENLRYGSYRNVITNVQMERLLAANGPHQGLILRPSDAKAPESIAFVQCAGSRDDNHLPYCSTVCCLASMKHALEYRERNPQGKAFIFYIDLRAMGRNEDVLSRVKADENIVLIKGKVARIDEEPCGSLVVEAEDILSGLKRKEKVGMVVLATGMTPNLPALDKVVVDEFGFFNAEAVEEGIFAAGCDKAPLDVSSALKDATGMALKAIQG